MNSRQSRMMVALAGAAAVVGGASAALAQQSDSIATVVGKRVIEDERSTLVSYRDLNLAAVEGEQTLRGRVKVAARSVCGPNDDLFIERPFSDCVNSARNGAGPQIDLAVRRAREIAATGTSSIPLVAIAVVGTR